MRARIAIALLCGAAVFPALADFKAGMEAYERGDFETALAEWRPPAERGMAEAQYNLGLMHQHGKGVTADPAAAHGWYLKAAEGGYARAQYRVAEMFESGHGVRKDLVQARLWFSVAGEQRYEDARKRRRKVADKMTQEQIAYADMLLRHRKRDRKTGD
jgi:TPR repeat protein